MDGQQTKQLIQLAIDGIVDGRAAKDCPTSEAAEKERRRARELQSELQAGSRPRPGLLSEAESVAEHYLRLVGRFAPDESLSEDMTIKVHQLDGRKFEVPIARWETVGRLKQLISQRQGNGFGELALRGGALRLADDSKLLFDLWLSHRLGSRTCLNPPWLQIIVRTNGG